MKSLICLFLILTHFSAQAAFRISSYNIRNFGIDKEFGPETDKIELAKTIASTQADLIGVQEIVEKNEFTQFMSGYFPGYSMVLSQCGGGGRQHLGIIYNPQKFNLIGLYEDMRISAVSPHSRIDCYSNTRPALIGYMQDRQTQKKFLFIVLHLKAGGGQAELETRYFQYEILKVILSEYRARGLNDIIIVGDLNSTEYILGPGNPYHQAFKQIISQLGLYDLTQNIPCTSYWSGGTNDNIEDPGMLDHLLASPSMINQNKVPTAYVGAHCMANQCRQTPKNRMGKTYTDVSDHCPILSDL